MHEPKSDISPLGSLFWLRSWIQSSRLGVHLGCALSDSHQTFFDSEFSYGSIDPRTCGS